MATRQEAGQNVIVQNVQQPDLFQTIMIMFPLWYLPFKVRSFEFAIICPVKTPALEQQAQSSGAAEVPGRVSLGVMSHCLFLYATTM